MSYPPQGEPGIPKAILTTTGDLVVASAPSTPARLGMGAALQQLRVNAGATALEFAAAGGAADYPMKLKPALVRWVIPGWSIIYDVAAVAITAARIYYIPIFVEETTTYIRIGINVGALAAGTADLRIFNWSNGLPGSLVLSAGTVDTGAIGAKEIIISQQLTRGYYFLAIRCSGAPSLNGPAVVGAVGPTASFNTSNMPTVWNVGSPLILFVDAAYADPAPAPTAAENVRYLTVNLREN